MTKLSDILKDGAELKAVKLDENDPAVMGAIESTKREQEKILQLKKEEPSFSDCFITKPARTILVELTLKEGADEDAVVTALHKNLNNSMDIFEGTYVSQLYFKGNTMSTILAEKIKREMIETLERIDVK
jgi:hypothetical protein